MVWESVYVLWKSMYFKRVCTLEKGIPCKGVYFFKVRTSERCPLLHCMRINVLPALIPLRLELRIAAVKCSPAHSTSA